MASFELDTLGTSIWGERVEGSLRPRTKLELTESIAADYAGGLVHRDLREPATKARRWQLSESRSEPSRSAHSMCLCSLSASHSLASDISLNPSRQTVLATAHYDGFVRSVPIRSPCHNQLMKIAGCGTRGSFRRHHQASLIVNQSLGIIKNAPSGPSSLTSEALVSFRAPLVTTVQFGVSWRETRAWGA